MAEHWIRLISTEREIWLMNNNQLHIMHAIHENQVLLENIRSDFHSTIRLCAFRLHFSNEKNTSKRFLAKFLTIFIRIVCLQHGINFFWCPSTVVSGFSDIKVSVAARLRAHRITVPLCASTPWHCTQKCVVDTWMFSSSCRLASTSLLFFDIYLCCAESMAHFPRKNIRKPNRQANKCSINVQTDRIRSSMNETEDEEITNVSHSSGPFQRKHQICFCLDAAYFHIPICL